MVDQHVSAHDPHAPPGDTPGYEKRDANLPAVVWTGLGLALLCVFTFIFIAYIFRRYESQIAASEKPQTALTEKDPVPMAPRLLVNGPAELVVLHAYETNLLNGYGWVQPAAGIARIPVDRALELVAERGLPTWEPDTNAVPTNAVSTPEAAP